MADYTKIFENALEEVYKSAAKAIRSKFGRDYNIQARKDEIYAEHKTYPEDNAEIKLVITINYMLGYTCLGVIWGREGLGVTIRDTKIEKVPLDKLTDYDFVDIFTGAHRVLMRDHKSGKYYKDYWYP